MKRNNKRYSEYRQSMFNKYSIDESYLQTGKQRRACLELLEKIDANQKIDEKSMVDKVASAFQGSALQKKVASCMTVAALLAILQSTPAMALASADRQPQAETVYTETLSDNAVKLDSDSYLDRITSARQNVSGTLVSLFSNPFLANTFNPLHSSGVLLDEDSDIALFPACETKTLTVIDTDLQNWETLRDAVNEGEILLLTNDEDPLDAIIEKLSEMGSVDCLNIVSHGESGKLKLKNGAIDSESLEANKDKWAEIASYLTKDADIQLYGCNIAKGDAGQSFLSALAEITGADVAASVNPTGSAGEGGDWTLEAAVGDVESSLPFAKDKLAKFIGILTQYDFSGFTDNGNNLISTYFTVSGTYGPYSGLEYTAQMDVDATSAFINSYNNYHFIIKITPKNNISFVLDDLSVDSFHGSNILSVNVIGHKADGSTGINSGTASNVTAATKTSFPSWNSFQGQQLDYFIIKGQMPGPLLDFSFNSFTVSNMNQVPVVTASSETTSYTENAVPVAVDSGITIFDDGTTLSSAMVWINDYQCNSKDVLEFTNDNSMMYGNIVASYDSFAGFLTLTSSGATAKIEQWQAALRAVKFSNSSEAPSTSTRTISFAINDGSVNSTAATKSVSVTAVNDAPSITSGDPLDFEENGTGTVYTATGNDPDGDTITWSISGTDASLFNIDSSTGALTFKTAPDYELPSDNDLNNVYNLTITATDNGTGILTATKDITITVTNVDEAPTITSGATANFTEGGNGIVYTATGTDEEGNIIIWIISGGADSAKFSINRTTGALTFISAPDYETPTDSDGNNTYIVEIQAFNGILTSTKTVTVTVTNVNEAPTIVSGNLEIVNENTTGIVYTADADDPDGDTITWSISGTDASLFNIDSSTGALTFNTAPNYELPSDNGGNNVYNLTITATDNGTGSLTATKDITITVTNVNEAPTITSGTTANFAEGGTGIVYTATGTDDEGDTITWSISGGADSDKFSINSTTGALTFKSSPDYETPTDSDGNNTYIVEIQVSDGTSTSTKTVTVTVTHANQAPVITSGTTANFVENGTGTVYTAAGTDPDGDAITWSISGTDASLFNIDSGTGALTFKLAPDFESPADNGKNNVYNLTITATDNGTGSLTATKDITITVTNVNEAPIIMSGATAIFAEGGTGTVYTAKATDPEGGSITWSINGGADSAKFSINSTTGVLTFKSAPDYETPTDSDVNNTYIVEIQASDGTSTSTKTVTVTVTHANQAPVITSATTASFSENGTGTVYTATGIDPDGDTITWSISGTDASLFNIGGSTGALTFKTAPDYDNPKDSDKNNVYNLTLTAKDNSSGKLAATKTIAIIVTNVNEAPIISTGDILVVTEGNITAFNAAAIDPEGGIITWFITGGADAAKFSIDPKTGTVAFNTAPSYITPSDADAHNDYVLQITASDGTLYATKTFTIIVTKNTSSGSGTSSGTATGTPANTVVEVNGHKQDAGTANTATVGGQSVTTITVDGTKLESILNSSGNQPTVTLPSGGTSDVLIGVLNGQTVKKMEQKEAVLEIKTNSVTYTLPASQINIDSIAEQIGSRVALKDIKVSVKIAEPSAETIKIVLDTANKNSYQIIVKPVEFKITYTYGNKTVEVSQFNGYVERLIAIPEGVNPAKITTGIVLNTDGTFRHVPTEIVFIDGKYYAKINSLTNSIYSVIWNPVEFKDVVNYWAQAAINDMGSRTVVEGDGAGNYNPNRTATRAEFAAIIVRAMGLAQGTAESGFDDVSVSDWFNGYVDTASAYGLISGYDDSSFGPNDTITREQAMSIIARAMKITGLNIKLTDLEINALLSRYSDGINISAYAKDSVAACLKAGIVNGTTAHSISPKKYVTRAEVAVMVQRLLQKSGLI